MHGVLTLLPASALALAFVASLFTVGGWIVTRLKFETSDTRAAHLAAGVTAYAAAGVILGTIGWFRWPLLAGLATVPCLAATPRFIRAATERWSRATKRLHAGLAINPVHGVLGLLTVAYVFSATVPTFHYDLLVNYLGVPKDYLIQEHLGILAHNVHSSLSMPLHVFIAFDLSLGELVSRSPFLFGSAPVWGAFHLIVIIAIGDLIRRMAKALAPDPEEAAFATVAALVLWLAMPQTLLLGVLENAEFLTTYLGLNIALLTLTARRRDDVLVIGALAGLMIGAKPQLAIFGFTALVLVPATTSHWKRIAAVGLAAALPLTSQLRNLISYGSFLYPYSGGSGTAADAAQALLAENHTTLPGSLFDLAERCFRLMTLQPETGLSMLALVAIFVAPVRRYRFWILAAVATLVPLVLSGNTANTLRWSQLGLVLLFLAAGLGLANIASRIEMFRWAVAAFGIAALWLAVNFTVTTLGPIGFLMSEPEAVLAKMIPDYEVRKDLVQRPGRVLWMGELYGFYGAKKGPIAAPQNGFSHAPLLGRGSPTEIWNRLESEGYRWICFNRRHRATGPDSAHWDWLGDAQRRSVSDLLAMLPAHQPIEGITVYEVGARSP